MKSPLRLLWLISFPAEVGAGWLLLGPGIWRSALALHVVASGIFGLSLIVQADSRKDWSWPLLGWTLSLLLFPVLGMLGMAIAFMLTHFVLRRSAQTTTKLERAVEVESPAEDVVARAGEMELSLLEEREVEPVVDVLHEEDPESKRAAIEAIAVKRDTGTVPLLRGLLHDPSPEARFFASISLSKLEDEISKSILSTQREVSANPDLPEARGRLARLYLDYVLSGFLEGVSRDYYLELAREEYDEVLEAHPHHDRLALDLAKVHLLLGNIANASAILEDLALGRPDSVDVHLARMEVIYEFGDFRELSVYARRALPGFAESADVHELVQWWAETGREGVAGAI
jgi:polysaccharide biosynthesis protein PelE